MKEIPLSRLFEDDYYEDDYYENWMAFYRAITEGVSADTIFGVTINRPVRMKRTEVKKLKVKKIEIRTIVIKKLKVGDI